VGRRQWHGAARSSIKHVFTPLGRDGGALALLVVMAQRLNRRRRAPTPQARGSGARRGWAEPPALEAGLGDGGGG